MTNYEKYETAKERAEAFREWARKHSREAIEEPVESGFAWLDLETEEEKPLLCPFCGGKVQVVNDTQAAVAQMKWLVNCYCCPYEYGAETQEKLIATHNRVAKAVMDAKAKEANND